MNLKLPDHQDALLILEWTATYVTEINSFNHPARKEEIEVISQNGDKEMIITRRKGKTELEAFLKAVRFQMARFPKSIKKGKP